MEIAVLVATVARTQKRIRENHEHAEASTSLTHVYATNAQLYINERFRALWANNDDIKYKAGQRVLNGDYTWLEAEYSCLKPNTPAEESETKDVAAKYTGSWGSAFALKPGQWRCDACRTLNEAADTEKCLACEAPKAGATPAAADGAGGSATEAAAATPAPGTIGAGGFSFGAPPPAARLLSRERRRDVRAAICAARDLDAMRGPLRRAAARNARGVPARADAAIAAAPLGRRPRACLLHVLPHAHLQGLRQLHGREVRAGAQDGDALRRGNGFRDAVGGDCTECERCRD